MTALFRTLDWKSFFLSLFLLFSGPVALSGCSREPLTPKLSSIESHIFAEKCAIDACHTSPRPEAFLNLAPGYSFENLVEVKSKQVSDVFLVEPNDPENSYLLHKLQGEDIIGEPMPTAAEPLPPEQIAVIKEWIAQGAPDN